MQAPRDIVHITSQEWRWVLILAIGFTALAFLPLLMMSGAGGDAWHFMGVIMNYQDGATYFAKMAQGQEGNWLIYFRHTAEPHGGVFIQVVYPALGHLARILDLPLEQMFHIARLVSAMLMYMALYYLGATIWTRLRTRRMFFLLVAICSGLGWFFSPLLEALGQPGMTSLPDLFIPEIYPFYSSLVNVHFPLAIASLALLASIMIVAFRPGATHEPGISNGGFMAALLSLALALLYPQALASLAAALALSTLAHWLVQRRLIWRDLRWVSVVALPALPLATYYAAIVTYNPIVAEWNRQNVTSPPSILVLVLGLGLPLLIAIPGFIRAVRRFDADGDRIMLLWLVAMLVLMYLPTSTGRRFAAGMMIPLAYFAARALEDFWFERVSRRWRYRLILPVIPLMTLSWLFVLLAGTQVRAGQFLPVDYIAGFDWLRENQRDGDVILASEEVSAWIPGLVGSRVVYGHPFETLNALEKEQAVKDWYAGRLSDCGDLPRRNQVRYIILGPLETEMRESGSDLPDCTADLTEVYQSESGDLRIYAVED
jgi:hypothetical protein